MILAQSDFSVGDAFLSILWFSLFVIWFILIFFVFADIIRRRDISGWAKAMWTVAIIILPFLGIFLYLIVNGSGMSRRREDEARAADEAARAYIREAAGEVDTSSELSTLADLHESGQLTDEEYEKAKARIFQS